MKKKLKSVADKLEPELQPMIKEWLRRLNLVPALTSIPLSDADRTAHLPKLYHDLITSLRFAEGAAARSARVSVFTGNFIFFGRAC